MPRLPRFVILGQPQHVIVRGVNRDVIFCADEDYQFYLDKLKLACEKYQCDLHAYVLMTNHVHLLITPHSEQGLAKVMQMIGRYYVQYFNYTYQRTGTLWEGRYKSTLIDSEQYLLTCYRYIELNPVRANMVKEPSEYRWSSYHVNALGKANALITQHREYKRLARNKQQRLIAYQALFNDGLHDKTVTEISEATNKGWVLGSDKFKQQIEKKLNRRASPLPKGGDRKSQEYKDSVSGKTTNEKVISKIN